MLKIVILVLFFLMLLSVMLGGRFLVADASVSKRLLVSLTTRVVLSTLLITTLVYGFWSGQLG